MIRKSRLVFTKEEDDSDKEYDDYVARNKITKKKMGEIDNSWTISEIVNNHVPEGWEEVFEQAKTELENISESIEESEIKCGRIVPDKKNIFKAFELTKLKDIKCVIFGMDPYQNLYPDDTPVSTGLAFSIAKGRKMQPSITNIFKELNNSIDNFIIPNHGDLSSWASQGVFLLNIALTTEVGVSGAHSKYLTWMPFMLKVVEAIGKVNPNCVYILLGKDAQKIEIDLKGKDTHYLKTSHPSGFSANRGFLGSNIFKRANELIMTKPPKTKKNSAPIPEPIPIDWNLE